MPRAWPLHHPTAAELHEAHAVYVENESRDYVYRISRHVLTEAGAQFTQPEAIDLLMRIWNAQSRYTWHLTLGAINDVLAATADARHAFEGRSIDSLLDDERAVVAGIYGTFRAVLGQTGAAKALGLLNPRFFPMWDTEIGIAYIGHKWSQNGTPPEYYLTFMDYCIEQCTTAVTEAEFGPTLLKTIDEWNYCIWSRGWLPVPEA